MLPRALVASGSLFPAKVLKAQTTTDRALRELVGAFQAPACIPAVMVMCG